MLARSHAASPSAHAPPVRVADVHEKRRRVVNFVFAVLLSSAASLACVRHGARAETWEVVDGEVVSTPLVSPGAMTSYIEARFALEQVPPDLETARAALGYAILSAPKDPHLWLTKAEIERLAGDRKACTAAIATARKLSADPQRADELAQQCDAIGAVDSSPSAAAITAD